jgi:hypothetical protein
LVDPTGCSAFFWESTWLLPAGAALDGETPNTNFERVAVGKLLDAAAPKLKAGFWGGGGACVVGAGGWAEALVAATLGFGALNEGTPGKDGGPIVACAAVGATDGGVSWNVGIGGGAGVVEESVTLGLEAGDTPNEMAALLTSAGMGGWSPALTKRVGVDIAAVMDGVGEAVTPGLVGSSFLFLSRSLAMASASKSCFSHFENVRCVFLGLPKSPMNDEVTRLPGPASDCRKGLAWRPTVAMD